MRAQAILLMMVAFLAAGCSGPKPEFYWYHPERTLKEVKADYRECELQARDEAAKAIEDEYFDRLRSPVALEAGDKPPAKKRKSTDPALQAKIDWGRRYKQSAFDGCMQGRSYVQIRAYQLPDGVKTKELPLGAVAGTRQ